MDFWMIYLVIAVVLFFALFVFKSAHRWQDFWASLVCGSLWLPLLIISLFVFLDLLPIYRIAKEMEDEEQPVLKI